MLSSFILGGKLISKWAQFNAKWAQFNGLNALYFMT